MIQKNEERKHGWMEDDQQLRELFSMQGGL